MPFVYLLLLALVWLQSDWPKLFVWLTPEGCAILVGTIVATSWLSAWLMAKVAAWQMARQPERRGMLMRRFGRWRRYHFAALLACFFGALYGLGWGHDLLNWWQQWVPSALQSDGNLPGFQVGVLAPFFLALLAAWERFHLVEKTAYELAHAPDRFIPKHLYLLMQVQHQFFLVLPPLLLMVTMQFLYLLAPPEADKSWAPAVIMAAVLGTALVLMPVLLRVFLGLKPLPPGALRDRLENTAQRLGFRYSNVLVWHTRHLMSNALVTGFVPWVRYIVLTDRLIDDLTPEEIEAVFGHEVGHIKHQHLFFYLAFFLTSFILLSVFWKVLKDWITQPDIQAALESVPNLWEALKTLSSFGKLGLMAGYTLLCFGFISRRCERQADLFGSTTVSTGVFISALEKVAASNGIPRDRAGSWLLSWQHPTIAQRVDFLQSMSEHPARVPQFHRSILFLKCSFFLALAFLIWWIGLPEVWKLLSDF